MAVFVSVLSLVSVIISDSIKAQRYSNTHDCDHNYHIHFVVTIILDRFHWKAYDSIDSFTLKDIFSSLLVAIFLHLAAILLYPLFIVIKHL